MSLRTSTPRLGTDGERKLIPHSGDTPPSVQGVPGPRGSDRQPRTLIAYSLGLGVLAATVALGLWANGATLGNPWVVVALCAAAVLTGPSLGTTKRDDGSHCVSSRNSLRGSLVRASGGRSRRCRLRARRCRASSTLGNQTCARPEMAYVHEHAVHLRRRDGVDGSGNPRSCRLNGWIVPGHDRCICSGRSLGNRVCGTHGMGQEQANRCDPDRRADDGDRGLRLCARGREPRVRI